MFNLLHLRQERETKAHQLQEILDRAEKNPAGPRPLSEDELTLFDTIKAEVENLDRQVTAVEEHERRREASQTLLDSLSRPTGRKVPPDPPARPDGITNRIERIPAECRRIGTLKAFKPRPGEAFADADARAYRSGKWIRAAVLGDIRAQDWCLRNGMNFRTDIRGAMGTNSNPDGGFLVPEELSDVIIDLREMYGVFRQNCRVWPMGSDTLMIPRRAGGVTIGAIGENPAAAITQSNPTFNMVQLVAKKAGGLTLMSSEIAEDAVIDLADWVAQEFAYGFALFEDQCGFIGDGTSTYIGMQGLTNLFANTALKGAVQAASTHDQFSKIDNTDLTSVMATLPQYAAPNAKWFASRVGVELVFGRLMAVAGGNTVLTLRESIGYSYLGYPIVISQVLPTTTGTQNLLPLLFFGDLMKSSSLGDRRQIRIFPSEHRYMDTDQIGIRGIERFDIVNNDVGDTVNAGPIVALLGRT